MRRQGVYGGNRRNAILLLVQRVQTRQEQDQQHQTVLPAVVGERQLRQPVPRERRRYHVQRGPGLLLHAREERIRGVEVVRFGEEGLDPVVEVGGYGGERGDRRVGFIFDDLFGLLVFGLDLCCWCCRCRVIVVLILILVVGIVAVGEQRSSGVRMRMRMRRKWCHPVASAVHEGIYVLSVPN